MIVNVKNPCKPSNPDRKLQFRAMENNPGVTVKPVTRADRKPAKGKIKGGIEDMETQRTEHRVRIVNVQVEIRGQKYFRAYAEGKEQVSYVIVIKKPAKKLSSADCKGIDNPAFIEKMFMVFDSAIVYW